MKFAGVKSALHASSASVYIYPYVVPEVVPRNSTASANAELAPLEPISVVSMSAH